MSIAFVTRLVSQMSPAKSLDSLHAYVVDEIAVPLRQLIKNYNTLAALMNDGYVPFGPGGLRLASASPPTQNDPNGTVAFSLDYTSGGFIFLRVGGAWVNLV